MRFVVVALCLAAAACSTTGAPSGPSNHGLTVTETNYHTEAAARAQANHDCSGYNRHAVLQNWNEETHTGVYVCQ